MSEQRTKRDANKEVAMCLGRNMTERRKTVLDCVSVLAHVCATLQVRKPEND